MCVYKYVVEPRKTKRRGKNHVDISPTQRNSITYKLAENMGKIATAKKMPAKKNNYIAVHKSSRTY